jgi:hypothetical protein
MTLQGQKDLAKVSALQADARKRAEASWRGSVACSAGMRPRMKHALTQMALADERHVAALGNLSGRLEREARTPARARQTRTGSGWFGRS